MQCPKCGKELKFPDRAYLNLQAYHQTGGRVLVASECCGSPFYLNMKQVFSFSEYNGDKKEDEWGVPFKAV